MGDETSREDVEEELARTLKRVNARLAKGLSDAQLAPLLAGLTREIIGEAPEEGAAMGTGPKGVGIWLRQFGDITPAEALDALDFVVVPGHRDTVRVYRNPTAVAWMNEYVRGGGKLWIMDWLPPAGWGVDHIPELAQWAKERGAVGVMADLEPDAGWRNAHEEAEAYGWALRQAADQRGLATSYTDYGRGGNSDRVMRTLLSYLTNGVPQSYDPNGTYVPNYHERSERYWRERGAQDITMGLGLWLRGERRHRTPAEFKRHLEAVDRTNSSAIAIWYAQGGARHLHAILPMLKAYRAPGNRPHPLDMLTPFGAAFRRWLS